MTGSGPAVSVADLTFNYGAMSVLEQISLDVPTGEIFGILGANGRVSRVVDGPAETGIGQCPGAGSDTLRKPIGRRRLMPQLNALYAFGRGERRLDQQQVLEDRPRAPSLCVLYVHTHRRELLARAGSGDAGAATHDACRARGYSDRLHGGLLCLGRNPIRDCGDVPLFVLQISYQGNIWQIWAVLVLLIVVGVSLGVFVSTFARNEKLSSSYPC